ncbi:U11/U12 small nuclear ribonucleoprotein 35 kDa protein-like [Mytilus trossulus]|uniref:U11/U12 small nuclear ribonucleoprotein 35 kDa protein-like n=1 Tax=Mytilus trossulus TaxID=6551 RepID=UPI0030079D7C
MDNWVPIAKVYDPLKAGSIDATDTEPHDHGIIRAMAAKYKPNKDVVGDPEKTIFIARLNPKTDETTIEKVYSGYGVIKQFRLVRDIITGYSRCYAFVEYYDHKEAEDAVWRGHKQEIDGCEVFVDYECERVLKGWVPRRLGGGFGGKKESGQLRFGGRDRPFRKPIYKKMIVNNEHYDNTWDDKNSEHDADGDDNYRGTNRVRSDRSNQQYYENLIKFKTSEKIQTYRERQQSRQSCLDRSRERLQTRDRSRERDQQYSRYDKSSREKSPHQSKHSRETAGERRGSNRDRDRIRSSDGSRNRIRDNRSRDRSRDRSGDSRQSRDRTEEYRSRNKSRDRSVERRQDRSEKRGKRSKDSKRETSEYRETEKYIDRKIDKGKHLERSDYRGQRAPETYDERTINRLIQSTMSSIWDEHDKEHNKEHDHEHDKEHDNEQNPQTENIATEDLEVQEN